MPKTTITYLDSAADERDFRTFHVLTLQVNGLVTLEGSFAVLYDIKNKLKNYYHANRILQIDQEFSHAEKIRAVTEYRSSKKAVVYYLKVDMEGDFVAVARQFGDKPYGFECVIADESNPHFISVLVPSFSAMVTIPLQRVIGMKVYDA